MATTPPAEMSDQMARALATRDAEIRTLTARQAASAEVLKAISASPDDPQPVFELIARRARDLCDARAVVVLEYDGALLHHRAIDGHNPEATARLRQAFPRPAGPETLAGRAVLAGRLVQVRDLSAEPGFFQQGRDLGARTSFCVPLLRDGRAIGAILLSRFEVRDFEAAEIALVESFAEQAVIAIASATALRELRTRTGDLQEALERQTATAEVLQVINASPGDLAPVFDAMLEKATRLCNAAFGILWTCDGERFHAVGLHGLPEEFKKYVQEPQLAHPETGIGRMLAGEDVVVNIDVASESLYHSGDPLRQALVDVGGARSKIDVALRKDGVLIGDITIFRQEVRPFSDKEIALLQNFAAQAVIAMENARLLGELQARTAELAARNSAFQEQVEHQAATIDVLKVMSASTNDTQPVFDIILRRAIQLSNATYGVLYDYDGEFLKIRTALGFEPDALAAFAARFPRKLTRELALDRTILDRQTIYLRDWLAQPALSQASRDLGSRSVITVPLLRGGAAIGAMAIMHWDRDGFADAHVELLKTFAEQAVIAIGSVGTFRELQHRTAELTRSVAELQALEEVLRAVNSSLDLETVLATIINRAVPLAQADEGMIYEFDAAEQVFVPKAAFGMAEDRIARLRERRIRIGETYLGRSALERAPLHIEDVQQDASTPEARELLQGIHAVLAVPLLREDTVVGGLVIRRRTEGAFAPATVALMQTFAAQCVLAIENARLFEESRRARAAAEVALTDLRRAQDRLVQAEKMASLGQLTAGIAHEIKNPLNFVNNFSDLSGELLDELQVALSSESLGIAAGLRAEIDDLTATLKGNLRKITEHGKRADGIVKNMLLHSRSGPVESRPVDLDAICEEALNLAYHGARASTLDFNITLEKDLGPVTGTVEMFPQDFTRALLNLIGNGFYAARKRAEQEARDFEPTLLLATRDLGDAVEIRVRDNGTGIAVDVREKIFDPFFTTKPAGEGTGLGLSLTFDIVVKQHGGQLCVDSEVGSYTEFVVTLPRSTPGGSEP